MSREEILAKIKGFEDKLEMDSFKDYHENFRQGIERLKGQLEEIGGDTPTEEKPTEEKPKAEEPKAEKKTPPKKKPSKKKPSKKTTKSSSKPTKDDYEEAMADLQKKSGMTEEKCLEIIEEYRALRKKSQERKAKENKAKTKKNADEKKRTDKLKEEGKLDEEGTLTPEAVIEQDTPKVEEKVEKEIEQIKEDNTPKPTKEEPKPKPTKQGEKKIKQGVKEVAEDTTDAIQEMLMAILGVVKNQEPTIAKASLIKLRDALTKEINSMAYGGLTDGAVANMNVTQSQMSAESVNPQMYAKGGNVYANKGEMVIQETRMKDGNKMKRSSILSFNSAKDRIEKYKTSKFFNVKGDLDKGKMVIVEHKNGRKIVFTKREIFENGGQIYEIHSRFIDSTDEFEADPNLQTWNTYKDAQKQAKQLTKDSKSSNNPAEYKVVKRKFANGGGIPTKFYWIEMDRDKIDEYIDFASRMRGIFENEIYTQGVNRVAFVTNDDRFSFTSMIENHNNDNDLNEGDEGYIYYKELYGDKAMPNIFDKISRDNYAKGGMTQGYNDRMDESLGMRHRGHHSQSHKDRRDESKGMNKGMGNRAYQSVGSMDKMAKGGMTQGYNDRMDESLGMRHRGHHSQSHKDRRDEAKGMNKGMGNRAYQSVGSMDKMAKGGSTNANWIQDVVDSPNFEKGAFTRKAKNRGMTTMELMKDVLSNPNEYTLKTRRQAQFMKNAM